MSRPSILVFVCTSVMSVCMSADVICLKKKSNSVNFPSLQVDLLSPHQRGDFLIDDEIILKKKPKKPKKLVHISLPK